LDRDNVSLSIKGIGARKRRWVPALIFFGFRERIPQSYPPIRVKDPNIAIGLFIESRAPEGGVRLYKKGYRII
jgi:hypothetical protein